MTTHDEIAACPYRLLGRACLNERGHGSPHRIEIEAAEADHWHRDTSLVFRLVSRARRWRRLVRGETE